MPDNVCLPQRRAASACLPLDNVPGWREDALPPRERRVICFHEGEVCSHVCRDRARSQETELRRAARASGARAVAEGECRCWDVTYGYTLNPKLRARASKRQHGGRRQDGLSQERG